MKIIIQITLALLLLFGLAACTQNDKVIGNRFGMWKVTEMTINGEKDIEYQNNMYWSFQGDLIMMTLVPENPFETTSISYGGCIKKGDKLILEYRNSDEGHPDPNDSYYSPLPESHLPSNTQIILGIIHLSGSRMELKYESPEDNEIIVYQLKKWD